MPRSNRSPAVRATIARAPAPTTRMAATDALFWYAEAAAPEFRPIIAGLYLLDRPLVREQIEHGTELAVALVPRLRQRVVEAPFGLGLPEWVEDRHFDLAYHLRHVSLPAPGTQRELLDLVGALFATPLDRSRPLWEAIGIDGVEGGGSAFFFKLHHAVVDGVGSAAILDALTTAEAGTTPRRVARTKRKQAPSEPSTAERLAGLARDQAGATAALARRALAMLAHPGDALDDAVRAARGLRAMVSDAARPPVHDPLAVPGSGLSRRLDIADVPLERLKKIRETLTGRLSSRPSRNEPQASEAHPARASINDVVLAALTGALRAYHRERHVHADELVCMVPMNLRGRDERDALGNRVGMFNVMLPVGEARADRRLARIVRQTQAAKADRRGAAAPVLVELLTLLPGAALRLLSRGAIGRVNVACTNVPGVRHERFMAGARVTAIHPFASVVEGTPLVMALLSYAGRMEIGIDTDPEAIPDPHRITELFLAALDELEALPSEGQPPSPTHASV